jgi:hypothetical protein
VRNKNKNKTQYNFFFTVEKIEEVRVPKGTLCIAQSKKQHTHAFQASNQDGASQ